jgi:hypothetical protein
MYAERKYLSTPVFLRRTETTLLHPSTTKIPSSCEHTFFRLSQTLWILLHMSNQWLFVTPQTETLTVLYLHETVTLKLHKEGKLTLTPGCRGNSSNVTLYAI